jgi:D-2-hydroxyacid dehydrogenase (NADP+)
MKHQITVVVTRKLEQVLIDRISAVDPRIKVVDASQLFNAEQNADFSSKSQFDAILERAEIIYGPWPPNDLILRAPRLKWYQSMLAGLDKPSFIQLIQSTVTVTNARGTHSFQVGELVFEMMLMFVKGAPFCFQLKQERRWEQYIAASLCNKTVGIVGLGSIGREVARLARAFRMKVVAIRRSVKVLKKARNVDSLLPPQQLLELCSESDFVILTVPAIPETDRLIGIKELRAMKPTAYLINVARGKVVDENALIQALEKGWIAGAGLDTFTVEPLPSDNRLWEFSNVIFTPHIGGKTEQYMVLVTELFCKNLKRYIEDKRLINVIDKKKGY